MRQSSGTHPQYTRSRSAPNALSLSKDGRRLFVANGGNNAVAVVSLAQAPGGKSVVEGFIPTAWYPGGLIDFTC
jgi:sugar lactone lactonase YvrE